MELNNYQLYYVPHTFTLTRPSYSHDEEHYEETDVLFIGFYYDDIELSLQNGLFYDSMDHKILQLLEKMKQEMSSQQRHYSLKLDLLVVEIIIELDRPKIIEVKPKQKENRISNAIRVLEDYYTQPMNWHKLSSLSGYSFDHFRHIFKEETGLSLIQFMMNKRIEHVMQLFAASQTPLSIIAAESGFSTKP
jgi:AraC-like DNA-binding protein